MNIFTILLTLFMAAVSFPLRAGVGDGLPTTISVMILDRKKEGLGYNRMAALGPYLEPTLKKELFELSRVVNQFFLEKLETDDEPDVESVRRALRRMEVDTVSNSPVMREHRISVKEISAPGEVTTTVEEIEVVKNRGLKVMQRLECKFSTGKQRVLLTDITFESPSGEKVSLREKIRKETEWYRKQLRAK